MKYYTVRDIAELLGVSKTTIQKRIRSNNIKYHHVNKNKQFYSPEAAKNIVLKIDPEYDISIFKVDNSTTESANSTTKVDNSTTESANSTTAADRMLDMLQAEIEKKDQMIKDLQDKLDHAYEKIADMGNQAQYITAADKTVQLLSKPEENNSLENDNLEKKSFLHKIFKRYK